MSFNRNQRRGQSSHQPRNDLERRHLMHLDQIRSLHPPNVDAVMKFILELKRDAENFLSSNNLQDSLTCYNIAILTVEMYSAFPPVAGEHHKLLGNRSLVFLRLRKFNEAERDACNAVGICPTYIKAYWRASQAVKGGRNGVKKALLYLVDGLNAAVEGCGNEKDVISFLVEICTLIPLASYEDSELMYRLNGGLNLPNEGDEIWMKVVERLIAQQAWEGVALLFKCLDDVIASDFDNLDFMVLNCEKISVGNILLQLPESKILSFGERLITNICDNGADIEDIGRKFDCPTLHYIVRSSLRHGSILLLHYITDHHYKNSHLKMNVVDKDGSTALHILVHKAQAGSPSQHVGKVLDILLRSKCDATIVDNAKKKPIDYITNKQTILYKKLFPVSTKSVEELRQDLDNFKSQGNTALKSGNHLEALQMYDAALLVSQKSQYLYKEAAILYSNKANVYCTLNQYTDALPNALAAINCDINYPKGYLWKGRALQHMGSYNNAFFAYMDGYNNKELTLDHRYVFLTDACAVLKDIEGYELSVCYNKLYGQGDNVWTHIVNRLYKNGEMKSVAYLMMNLNLSDERFKDQITVNMIRSLLTGHAAKVCTLESPANCILSYIKECNPVKEGPWLDALLCIIIHHGTKQTWLSLAVDDNDIALHAALRFCLSINRTSLLENFVPSVLICENRGQNKAGDTAFHCITKHKPVSDPMTVYRISKLLVNHGLSITRRDGNGKLAVEYLDNSYPGLIFDYYLKEVPSVNDVNKLKEAGNTKYKNKKYNEALDCYSKAIEVYEDHCTELREQLKDHGVAILYGNRAETYLAMRIYDLAMQDALHSLDFDCHWHKAHMRVGKCMKAKGLLKEAVERYSNAYKLVESHTDIKIKVEILTEVAIVWETLPATRERIQSLPTGIGHLWLHVCYKMVETGQWNVAAVSYLQYTTDKTKPCSFRYDLKIFCNPELLTRHHWVFDVLIVFLKYGCDRHTISIMENDHYMQAIIIMTILFGQNINLLSYVVRRYRDHKYVDRRGNTLLHFCGQIRNANAEMRSKVLAFLLESDVNPNLKNHDQHLAIDYIAPYEVKSWTVLQNATRIPESKSKPQKTQKSQTTKSKPPTLNASNQSTRPKMTEKHKKECEECLDLKDQIASNLKKSELEEGYGRMVDLCKTKHKGRKHDGIVRQAVNEIAHKLSETFHPELPNVLTKVGGEVYLMIVDKLASSNKWRQLDMLVRKYRQVVGSDQLKGFASDLTVVPLIRDSSLKTAEDRKVQILNTIISGGASLGSDNGQMAIKCAVTEEHYKVLIELVKNGADTSKLSMYDGDTPIHAALVIVLEKEKSNYLLEVLLEKYYSDPEANQHLDPEQLDACGDCIFHRIAKCKFNNQVLKLTELLCDKGKISANYVDKDNRLPTFYITRKNDRRLQYFKLAQSLPPSRKQSSQTFSQKPTESKSDETDELLNMTRPADSQTSPKSGTLEVPRFESEKEKRKKRVEELINLLPDSKYSIFSASHLIYDDRLDNPINEEVTDTTAEVTHAKAEITDTKAEVTDKGAAYNKPDLKHKKDVKEEEIKSTEEFKYDAANDVLTTSEQNQRTEMKDLILGGSNKVLDNIKENYTTLNSDIQSDDSMNEEFVDAVEDLNNNADEERTDINEKHNENKFTDADDLSEDANNKQENSIHKRQDKITNRESYTFVRHDEIMITETDETAPKEEIFDGENEKSTTQEDAVGRAIEKSNTYDKDVSEIEKSVDLDGSTVLELNKTVQEDTITHAETDNSVVWNKQDIPFTVEENRNNNAENELKSEFDANDNDEINPKADTNSEEVDEGSGNDRCNEVESAENDYYNNEDVDDGDDEEDDDFEIDVQVFDNLEWEVECTAEVWKTLRDKHVLPDLKRRIVRKVQLLASGDWHPHLCKKLKGVPATINLFEAKFSKGRRIIWELAIAFSPRLSESAELRLHGNKEEITQPVRGGRIYSEIIRVWEIVLDHDKINRSVQKIKKSHQRGECCIIQKSLRGMKVDNDQITTSKAKRYPNLFAEDDISVDDIKQQHEEIQRFFPPASSNETEYHILKFYSFSSTLVNHVLQNIETKVDFPFRVTDLEHAIINLKSNAPILLLGRSGTGKTTCCLYRLWSKFHAYWTTAKQSGPLLPRGIELIHQDDVHNDDESENTDKEDNDDDDGDDDTKDEIYKSSSACGGIDEENCSNITDQFDHLHQIFITKNAVLSNEVQKNFRELSHADNLMEDQVRHEEDDLPHRLQDVQDYSYPLFLTSRQLLLMLDASLGPPHFFDRKADGSLKVDIAGWTDLDGPLSFLPMLDDDSDIDENEQYDGDDDDDDNIDGHSASVHRKKLKVDPRREITYIVFVEEIWPKIQKKDCNFHPSLVWMEIMSFIKGSYEALSKQVGYLDKNDYIKLGRKRAPNFSSERDSIYRVFKRYEHFKKQNSLFDETDFVHHVFNRLRKQQRQDWIVHQIFVDETQDFTQAELCLLIRLCQNPNELFLTGDTAQSIMRGISFRFSDLRSLFYHAKQSMKALGKTSAVAVPKEVYQLTHNYRSHAGILSLATSVLELMVEFFPESFDRLQPDQGLFHGPPPILLESCSFSDLAVLLKGNRRKTSRIEFGAHQAILVVNDAARDNIPEELRLGLVLTIYEAKGLEFDDVLLYNFFKDSQASKEWRVVTSYLEQLADKQREETDSNENLVQIDHELLSAKGRPRSLEFDSQQHKVLNSELKHLYTALTRARVNVWMFDEDPEKKAPMFEYFKARKLVKSMQVEEINEASLADTVFAEKSSPSDWIKRGEDFMKHSLYTVAAKCFAMGGARDREKIALAHGQALAASRLRDNPKKMHEEFMCAAELYLECNKPAKAALCLQNAKERDLAAGLFEKLGQFERAGDIYKRMKRPVASSKCYEQLGNYKKAVDVLYDSENYDMAIDAFKRYEMHVKSYEEKKLPVPRVLTDNKPTVHTVENMSYRAAQLYHRLKNKERMLAAVDRFVNFEDKVTFLTDRKYIFEAAQIYEENCDWEPVTRLYLAHGYVDKAIAVARKSNKDDILANTLLVACRKLLFETYQSKHDGIMEKVNMDIIMSYLTEARSLDESRSDYEHLGQVEILLSKVCYDIEVVKRAWKVFLDCRPCNEAGLVECCDMLIENEKLGTVGILHHLVKGVKYIFNICKIFEGTRKANTPTLMKYFQFYGLEISSQEKLTLYPNQMPLFLQMSSDMKIDLKKTEVEIEIDVVKEKIVQYLLNRVFGTWFRKISEWLEINRDCFVECSDYQVGNDCSYHGNDEKPCRKMHSIMTVDKYKKLIELDLLMMEFEKYASDGLSDFAKKCKQNLKMKALIEQLLYEYSDPKVKYRGCHHLWNDLIPPVGHPMFISTDSKALLEYLRKNDVIASHFKNFLLKTWDDFTSETKKFESRAVMETETYLLFQFGCLIFNLQNGKVKLAQSPIKHIISLETQLDREACNNTKLFKNRHRYTVIMEYGEEKFGRIYVTCIAKRFLEAIDYLTGDVPNPFESVMKFGKFQIQLTVRRDPSGVFYPDMKHYLFWLEFYTSLAIMIMAKLKSEDFPNLSFFLPSNYFALIQFVQASLPGSYTIEDHVAWWDPGKYRKRKTIEVLSRKLSGFGFVVSGLSQGKSMLEKILEECTRDISNIVVLERFLILAMTFVCNIGETVPFACELSLLSTLSHIEIPDYFPGRIKHVLQSLKQCGGISDVGIVMNDFLKERGREENVMMCRWSFERKHRLEKKHCKNFSVLSKEFYNEKTLLSIQAYDVVTEPVTDYERHEDVEQDEEEKEQGLREKQAKLEEDSQQEERTRAAIIIQRLYRKYINKKQTMQKDKNGISSASVEDSIFDNRRIDDKMCGLCNFSFSEQLRNKLETERSTLIGDTSVLNTKAAEGQPWALQSVPSIEDGQSAVSAVGDTRALELLKQIKENHFADQTHIQKAEDFINFKEVYLKDIKPCLENVNLFFNNPEYRFDNEAFVDRHYGRMLLKIKGLKNRCKTMEKELTLLLSRPVWDEVTAFHITSNIPKIETYNEIKSFVTECLTKVKEKQLANSSHAAALNDFDENYDDDNFDDNAIEQVVEDSIPRFNKNKLKTHVYRRKNYYY